MHKYFDIKSCLNTNASSLLVCIEIEEGGKVLFGPNSRKSSANVQSIANFLDIPHLQYHWDPYDVIGAAHGPWRGHMTINVYPYSKKLAEAHRDIINHWRWKKFTVIYEDDDGRYTRAVLLVSQMIRQGNIIMQNIEILFKNL